MAWLERSFPPEIGDNFRLYEKVLTWDEDHDVQYKLSIRTFPKGYSRVEVERWDYEESYWRPTNDWPKNLLPLLIRLAQEAEPESVAFESPIFGEGSVSEAAGPRGEGTVDEGLWERIERAYDEGVVTGAFWDHSGRRWITLTDSGWNEEGYRIAYGYQTRISGSELEFCRRLWREGTVTSVVILEAVLEVLRARRSLLVINPETAGG
jgi:hypothetical protein